jgi:hypothetical protein
MKPNRMTQDMKARINRLDEKAKRKLAMLAR